MHLFAAIAHDNIPTGIDMKYMSVFTQVKPHSNAPSAIKVLETAEKRKYMSEDIIVLWLTNAICAQEVSKARKVLKNT